MLAEETSKDKIITMLKALEKLNIELHTKLEKSIRQNKSLFSENENLKIELTGLKNVIDSVLRGLGKETTIAQNLDTIASELAQSITRLLKLSDERDTLNREYQTFRDNSEETTKTLRSRIVDLNKDIIHLTDEMQRYKEAAEESAAHVQATSEAENNTADTTGSVQTDRDFVLEIENLEQKNIALQSKLNETTLKYADLEDQLIKHQVNENEHKQVEQSLLDEILRLSAVINEFEAAVKSDTQVAENTNEINSVDDLSSQIAVLKIELLAQKDKATEYEELNTIAKQGIVALEQELKTINDKLIEAKSEINIHSMKNNELENELLALTKDYERIYNELEALRNINKEHAVTVALLHIAALSAELNEFKLMHPDSDLLKASNEVHQNTGRPKTRGRLIYEAGYYAKADEMGIENPEQWLPN